MTIIIIVIIFILLLLIIIIVIIVIMNIIIIFFLKCIISSTHVAGICQMTSWNMIRMGQARTSLLWSLLSFMSFRQGRWHQALGHWVLRSEMSTPCPTWTNLRLWFGLSRICLDFGFSTRNPSGYRKWTIIWFILVVWTPSRGWCCGVIPSKCSLKPLLAFLELVQETF